MLRFYRFCSYLCIFMFVINAAVSGQTNYPVPIKMSFDQTSFNQLIGQQYNDPGFVKTYTETINGSPVVLSFINRPFGELATILSMRFLLTLETIPNPTTPTVTKLDSINIQMPLLIESIKLKTMEEDPKNNGVYIKLDPAAVTTIVDQLSINGIYKPFIKTVLTTLAGKEWKIANPTIDAKLFESISPHYNVSLGNTPTITAETDGRIAITLDPTIQSERPGYDVWWYLSYTDDRPDDPYFYMYIESNNKFTISKSFFYIIYGDNEKNSENSNIESVFNSNTGKYWAEVIGPLVWFGYNWGTYVNFRFANRMTRGSYEFDINWDGTWYLKDTMKIKYVE